MSRHRDSGAWCWATSARQAEQGWAVDVLIGTFEQCADALAVLKGRTAEGVMLPSAFLWPPGRPQDRRRIHLRERRAKLHRCGGGEIQQGNGVDVVPHAAGRPGAGHPSEVHA